MIVPSGRVQGIAALIAGLIAVSCLQALTAVEWTDDKLRAACEELKAGAPAKVTQATDAVIAAWQATHDDASRTRVMHLVGIVGAVTGASALEAVMHMVVKVFSADVRMSDPHLGDLDTMRFASVALKSYANRCEQGRTGELTSPHHDQTWKDVEERLLRAQFPYLARVFSLHGPQYDPITNYDMTADPVPHEPATVMERATEERQIKTLHRNFVVFQTGVISDSYHMIMGQYAESVLELFRDSTDASTEVARLLDAAHFPAEEKQAVLSQVPAK